MLHEHLVTQSPASFFDFVATNIHPIEFVLLLAAMIFHVMLFRKDMLKLFKKDR